MNNKNFKLQELKRWLKTSLKNKISINEKTVITYLMMGFAGLMISAVANANWIADKTNYIHFDNGQQGYAGSLNINATNTGRTDDLGTVFIAKKDSANRPLRDSVVIGFGENNGAQKNEITVEEFSSGTGYAKGIVAVGSGVRIHSNPHQLGRTGTGGQAVAIGNDITSTSQAVAIGNNTYALGNASIAIGSDDISSYKDKFTKYDYDNYMKALYDSIDPNENSYGRGNSKGDGTGESIDRFSPNVAGGTGSIAIGSRTISSWE